MFRFFLPENVHDITAMLMMELQKCLQSNLHFTLNASLTERIPCKYSLSSASHPCMTVVTVPLSYTVISMTWASSAMSQKWCITFCWGYYWCSAQTSFFCRHIVAYCAGDLPTVSREIGSPALSHRQTGRALGPGLYSHLIKRARM